jgi:Domain of unknown function (DUF5668)
MNCANHSDTAAVAYCRACGKALCPACERTIQGTVFCEEHAAQTAGTSTNAGTAPPYASSPYIAPAQSVFAPNLGVSPGLAFILGLIPGVGAIYNSQYAKGLVHVLVFTMLIAVASNASGGEGGIFVPIFMAWEAYMAFEAYHTAKKRQLGEVVDEFSSLLPLRGKGFPIAPVVLIVLGVIFLLNNLDLIRFRDVARYWPVFLIALGVYMLYVRVTSTKDAPLGPEATNERN